MVTFRLASAYAASYLRIFLQEFSGSGLAWQGNKVTNEQPDSSVLIGRLVDWWENPTRQD